MDKKGHTPSYTEEEKKEITQSFFKRLREGKSSRRELRVVRILEKIFISDKKKRLTRAMLDESDLKIRRYIREHTSIDMPDYPVTRRQTRKRLPIMYGTAAAAAILILVMLNLPMIRQAIQPDAMLTAQALVTDSLTTERNIKSFQLSDGTVVYLNVNSKLFLRENKFTAETREVWLDEGEAFFEVAKDSLRPFIVHTADGLQTRVLGTSFNIKAYAELTEQVISVRTGKVQVSTAGGDAVQLTPDRKVNYGKECTLTESEVNGALAAGWIEGDMVFDGADSKEIALRLKQYYGLELKLEGKAVNKVMNFKARYPKETSIVQFARGICSIYGLKYELTKGQLILR